MVLLITGNTKLETDVPPSGTLSYMKHAMGMQNIEGFRDQRRVDMKPEASVGGRLALHWRLTNTQTRTLLGFTHPNAG